MMSAQSQTICPRCHLGRLSSWDELTEEQREVVLRLPASADHTLEERQMIHRWCTTCWHEETENSPEDA
ncbi:MAG TPA: hypothetical protein VF791_00470 [Pyrinomonadaceae bacterium]